MHVRRAVNEDDDKLLTFAQAAVEIVGHLQKGMLAKRGYRLVMLTDTSRIYKIDYETHTLDCQLANRLERVIELLNCDNMWSAGSMLGQMFKGQLSLAQIQTLSYGISSMRQNFDANVAALLLAWMAGQPLTMADVRKIGHEIVWEASISEMTPNDPSFAEAVAILQS